MIRNKVNIQNINARLIERFIDNAAAKKWKN